MHSLIRRVRVFRDRFPFVGPALWMLCVQYFIVQPVVAAAWRNHSYSLRHNTISDLANTACGRYGGSYVCSPLHALMNVSFIVLGLTMFFGAVLLYHEFRRSPLSATGFTGMALAGLGTLLVGLFPENTVALLHIIGAALPFLVGNVSIGVLGLALPLPRWFKLYSLATSAVTLSALALLLGGWYLGIGDGGMERIVSYPQTLWLIAFGIYVSQDRYRRLRAGMHLSA